MLDAGLLGVEADFREKFFQRVGVTAIAVEAPPIPACEAIANRSGSTRSQAPASITSARWTASITTTKPAEKCSQKPRRLSIQNSSIRCGVTSP